MTGPRIRATLPDFQAFAGRALDAEDVAERVELWRHRYRSRHGRLLDLVGADGGGDESLRRLMRELRGIRARVQEAGAVVPGMIEELEPRVRDRLDAGGRPEPLHVLLVGTMGANALVAPVGDDLAVLHCLEWFADAEAHRALVAHEDTHAWHRRLLGAEPPDDDPAWRALSEGVAVRVSREVVPDLPDRDHFWYGIEGFEEWLPWCRDHRRLLLSRFREGLAAEPGSPAAAETVSRFFGGGFVEGRWRTGFFLADRLVAALEPDLPELCRLEPARARTLVRGAVERL